MFDSTARRGARILARVVFGLALYAGLCATAVAQRPTGGLVAHYPLDRSLEDVTPNSYDGQSSGGPTYATGLAGQALRFDGVDDALRFTRLPNTVFAGDFTVSWHMNAQSLDEWSLLSKRDACTSGNWFEVGGARTGSDQIAFGLSRAGIGATLATARQTWFAPGWVHVAVVRRGTEAVVYVDGEAGVAVTLPALNFSGIGALLGFSNSPCIGTGGVRAYQGLLDEVRVYNRALTAREIDGLASSAQLTVTPSSIAPGGSLSYTATELDIGTTYTLKLFDGAANPVLDSFSATAVEQRRRVTMPNAAAGRWPLSLQVPGPRLIVSTHASTTLTVAQGLGLVVRTTRPQAGKSLLVDVSRLAPGRLQLRYAGRIVFGPITLDGTSTTRSLKFVAPSDIPPTFPANVELRAELLVGRNIARNGTAQVSVAAPFSGPFALPTGVTTSVPVATPRTRVNVRGRLQLADGATPADLEFSAYWVGNDGTFTPLPTHALAINADGTFDLATRPPGLATMTAGIANGPGRVRMVGQRMGQNGRREWEAFEGPNLETSADFDPQTDITFTIRRVGGNVNEPVSNALIVFDPVTPIQEFDLPPAPPAGGNSDYLLSGQSLFGGVRVNDTSALGSNGPLLSQNQISGLTPNLPEPPCGPDLFRRYTDGAGRASIDLLGSSPSLSGLPALLDHASYQAQQFRADVCSAGTCRSATQAPLRFRARIYTVHRGAGVISGGREQPLVFEFLFDRSTRQFTITNLRTGQITTQTNSVNLSVQVPVLSGVSASNYVYIQTPFVLAVSPAFGTVTRTTATDDIGMGSATFSGWVNFGATPSDPPSPTFSFQNAEPQFSLSFFHRPDAGGALTSARLYLVGFPGTPERLYGNFVRNNNTPLCTLQEDGSFTGNHVWELRLQGADWRDPSRLGAILFSRGTTPSISGRIEYRNAFGAVSNYPVTFKWKAPPNDILTLADVPNPQPVTVSDIKVGVVQYLAFRALGSDSRERTLISPIGGNNLEGPRTKRNETATSQLVNIITDGNGNVAGGTRVVSGDVAKQYNEGPRNRSLVLDAGGEIRNFGPREYTTLLDLEVPLLQVTWGIPGLAGVDAYAALQLVAEYWFGGRVGVNADGAAFFEALTDAVFSVALFVGIDIDVLFGLLFDAGIDVTGGFGSSIQTGFRTGTGILPPQNCMNLFMNLGVHFDPCPICPTPAISESYNVVNSNSACPTRLDAAAGAPLVQEPQPQGGIGIVEQRGLRRHAALRFDERGNGGMLALDDNRNLTYTSLAVGDDRPAVQLSTAPGQRQPSIVYYAENRAISVWVENALTTTELRALNTNGYNSPGFGVVVRNQRLAWSKYNGSTWTPKQFLTLPGSGEGFPVIEACKSGASGCPVGGSVFLAFQRNTNGDYALPRNRIFHAAWTPSAGWTAVTQTPAGTSATQDITPSVVFVDGRPLLTWIRISSANQLSLQRRLMWQFPGLGPVNGEDLPNGANSVSLLAQQVEAGRNMFGAFMAPETNTSIIGSGQAMYLLRGLCTIASQTCDFAFNKARVADEPDSAVYGDRPAVSRTNSGRSIIMRVYSFTPKDPVAAKAANERKQAAFEEWRNAKDPLHKQAALRGFELSLGFGASADLYRLTANFVTGEVVPTALTADGGNYLGATSSYDTFRDRFVFVGSPVFAPQTAAGLRAQANTGALSRSVPARTLGVVNGLEIRETDDVPDLRVDEVRITSGTFGPSARLNVTVSVTNAGSAFVAATDGPVQVHLRLGAPTGRGLPLASATVPNLASGERRDFVLSFTAPANAHADEENMFYARLMLDAETPDLDGDNNVGVLPIPGLPVPQTIAATTRKGMPVTQLQWRGSTDPRVVGYRVYRREANGRYVPLGASAVEGFLDLSAQFGVMRTYAVTSYSRRGVESELSEATSGAPEAALAGPQGDDLFSNGFEALVP